MESSTLESETTLFKLPAKESQLLPSLIATVITVLSGAKTQFADVLAAS